MLLSARRPSPEAWPEGHYEHDIGHWEPWGRATEDLQGALDVAKLLTFLKRLVKDAKLKVFLDPHTLSVHKARRVTAWAVENARRIELFCLPPYSPELSPDEYSSNTGRAQVRNNPLAKSHDELHASLIEVMHSNQRRPAGVRALFRHPAVASAA